MRLSQDLKESFYTIAYQPSPDQTKAVPESERGYNL